MIGIDDQINYYHSVIFGDTPDPFRASFDRAFRDFSRTIVYPKGITDFEKRKWRDSVYKLLVQKVTPFYPIVDSQDEFDLWHEHACLVVIDSFRDGINILTYGQAQKWLNMFMKYLFLLDNNFPSSIIPFLHVPIDNVILDVAKTDLGINRPPKAWSKWDFLEYVDFQMTLRKKISSKYSGLVTPFEWEFKHWN